MNAPHDPGIYGVMGMFDSADALLDAARRTHAAGYRRMDAFSPFPVEGLSEVLGQSGGRMSWITLPGAVFGGLAAYAVQYWTAVIDYPVISGGKPLHSWPAFVPVTFEMAVLGGALAAVGGMLVLNGLPRLHHPVFDARNFSFATRNRFFLLIEARDEQFDPARTEEFLTACGAREVSVVPA